MNNSIVNTKLPVQLKYSAGPLSIALICIIFFLLQTESFDTLSYHRHHIEQGQWYLLLSGHFLHTNSAHLLLNMAGILLLWFLHGHFYTWKNYCSLVVFCALATGIGLWVFSPEMIWYVGLSGALHGVFVWGACRDIQHKVISGWFLLVGVTIKLLWEQASGGSEQVVDLIGTNVAVDAHLYGALAGVLFWLLWARTAHSNQKDNS